MYPMEEGEKAWKDQNYTIDVYPTFLKGGFFVQKPLIWNTKDTEVSIVVIGKAIIYIAIEEDISQGTTGGYETSLPNAGWKKEVAQMVVTETNDIKTFQIFSKKSRFNVEKTIVLPLITTTRTIVLISVVPICSGKSKAPT